MVEIPVKMFDFRQNGNFVKKVCFVKRFTFQSVKNLNYCQKPYTFDHYLTNIIYQ